VSTSVPAPKDAPLRQRASVFTDEITMDFADACRTAAEAGLQYVDIRKVWGVFSHEVPRERWGEMARILADNGLRIGAVQSNFGKCPISGPEYDAHLRFLPVLVEQAQYFGTDTMRVFPFWNETKLSYDPAPPGGIRLNLEEMLPEIVRRFRPAADLAAREGIRLGFEPEHSTYSGSPQEVARIVTAVDNPNVGVAWDANNGWDDATIDEAYTLFKGKVVNVHVKERVMSPDERRAFVAAGGEARRQPALLGTGAMPWPHIIATLERDGYRGVYAIETHIGSRGAYGWPKLKAATTYYLYALRELLEGAEAEAGGAASAGSGAGATAR
ncbi:MAG: sugar phosphate isomerase/epimerase family protein, partial [Chloroflexota bacterium]